MRWGGMWADNQTTRDFLNFEGVATSIAQLIFQADCQPVSIGVSGAWGVGKSSLLGITKHMLQQPEYKPGDRKYVFVDFNAWLYQGFDDARAALLDVVASTLAHEAEERRTAVDKVADFGKRVRWVRLARMLAVPAAAAALGLPPIGLLGSAVGLVGAGLNGTLNKHSEKAATDAIDSAAEVGSGLLKPQEESPPQGIQDLRDSFEAALDALGIVLVVLVDDLDRCLPETAVSTLEAIRLLLFLDNTAFVIAADDDLIRQAVRKHFDDVPNSSQVTNYFDKLIQVPIRVPSLGVQEVRAYMMMLHIDASEIGQERKDALQTAIAAQLKRVWQGERVNRAFVQQQDDALPPALIAQLDSAERLAPLLTRSTAVTGNPRLVKRFLNALAIRMAVASAQGISVEADVLAKLLLFERIAPPGLYPTVVTAVVTDAAGHAGFIGEMEQQLQDNPLADLPAEWNDDALREWLTLAPPLGPVDLRGALYVSREYAPVVTDEDRLSSDGIRLLKALLDNPELADAVKEPLIGLSRQDLAVLLDKLLGAAAQEEDWGAPPILTALVTVADIDPSQASRVAGFLTERPLRQIQASIVPQLQDRPWAQSVLDRWRTADVTPPVKRAIGAVRGDV